MIVLKGKAPVTAVLPEYGSAERALLPMRGLISGAPKFDQIFVYGNRADGSFRRGTEIWINLGLPRAGF